MAAFLIKGFKLLHYEFLFHPNNTFGDPFRLILHLQVVTYILGYPPFQVFPHELNINQLKTSYPIPPSPWEYHILNVHLIKIFISEAKMEFKCYTSESHYTLLCHQMLQLQDIWGGGIPGLGLFCH